jgi:hypothetical protein
MAEPWQARKTQLTTAALERRRQWVCADWQASPSEVSKADVLALFCSDQPSTAVNNPAENEESNKYGLALRAVLDFIAQSESVPILSSLTLTEKLDSPLEKSDVSSSSSSMPVSLDAPSCPSLLERLQQPGAADVIELIKSFLKVLSRDDFVLCWRQNLLQSFTELDIPALYAACKDVDSDYEEVYTIIDSLVYTYFRSFSYWYCVGDASR